MLTAEENTTLTRTGPGTPMGDVFRCYWMPALLSCELEADGPPVRVKLLGEDFIAFRDSDRRVGIVEPHCPHRGANLFFGRNERCGLRCAYHGWKFDVDGNCVDMPTSFPDIAEKLKPQAGVRALQVREWGEMIWAYFGTGAAPELPQMEFATLPPDHRFVSKKYQQCNWAQPCEGGLDTAHFSYLHAGIHEGEKASLVRESGDNEPPSIARYRWLIEDGMPRFSVLKHKAGLVLGAARKADNNQLYWRITQFMMPNHSLAPNSFPGENNVGNTWVPIDDRSCWIYCYAWNSQRPLTGEECDRLARGSGIFAEVDENYVPIRNRDNDYLIDRSLQKQSSFTGIRGISEQDAAIADSQGFISDRTKELLGPTDLGVVRFRKMMLEAAKSVADGETPHGADAAEAYLLRSGDAMSTDTEDLADVLEKRFGKWSGVSSAA